MKVAISVPDELFEEPEAALKRLRVPRSRFYSKALEAYLRTCSEKEVSDRLNAVYQGTEHRLDPVVEALSLEVLRREPWNE